MKYRQPSSQELYAWAQKGRTSEERFRHLLSDPAKKPSWISKVEHSNRQDDYDKGIDFYVFTTTGWKIPVDVKSSMWGFRKHVAKRGAFDICLIVVDSNIDDDAMRSKIVDFIARFQEKVIRRGKESLFKQ